MYSQKNPLPIFAYALVLVTVYLQVIHAQRQQPFINPAATAGAPGFFPQVPFGAPNYGSSFNMPMINNNFIRNPLLHNNPMFGASFHGNPWNAGWSSPGNNNAFNQYGKRQEEIYTAIGYDRLDPNR